MQIIFKNAKIIKTEEDLKKNLQENKLDELFFTITVMMNDWNIFLRQTSLNSLSLKKAMIMKLENLAHSVLGDLSLFKDTIYHFLRICGARHIFFVEKINYIIVSNLYETRKEDLQQIFNELFDMKFEIYPFPSSSEITFSYFSNEIYHSHAHNPTVIINELNEQNEKKSFELFINYLFLFTLFSKLKKIGLYMYNFKSFNDVYLEFCTSHEKFEKTLLAISNVFPTLRFLVIDSSDRFIIYKQNNKTIELPNDLFPSDLYPVRF
jgi:hypothetical protein